MSWELDPETRTKLQQLQKKDGLGNNVCCDCGAPSPRWASPKFSTFICLTCAGTHRGLGVHISFVRSVDMDAFKKNEIDRMANGGNKAWQDFYNKNSTGGSFDESTIKERYDSEVGEEWKERLTCKVESRDFNMDAFKKERTAILQKQATRSQTPVGARGGVSSGPPSRPESPAKGLPPSQKAKNEAYFSRMGEANASRPADLPPSQGGKYAGFGSSLPEPPRQQDGGIPSADEFQKDPVAALTKGFGWFTAAVGKQAKVVNDSYIQPTAKNIAASDFAAQARVAAAQAGQTIQSGAKGAAENFNKFVEGQQDGGAAARRKEPERKDFWDSFGAPAESTVGTSAMKSAASGGPTAKGKKDESWGDDW